ncbi:MAG TPA: hypothetical protein VGH32_04915 [Pirellulales bacterium]
MRPLLIGPDERAAIAKVKEIAAANPLRWETLKGIAIDDREAPTRELKLADRPEGYRPPSQFVELPVGYMVAFSIEEQPAGWLRHLSVSVDKKGKLPHPEAMRMIALEFGMARSSSIARVWLEEFEPGHEAVNLVELITQREEGKA